MPDDEILPDGSNFVAHNDEHFGDVLPIGDTDASPIDQADIDTEIEPESKVVDYNPNPLNESEIVELSEAARDHAHYINTWHTPNWGYLDAPGHQLILIAEYIATMKGLLPTEYKVFSDRYLPPVVDSAATKQAAVHGIVEQVVAKPETPVAKPSAEPVEEVPYERERDFRERQFKDD
jgi:hypothetical protein